MALVGLAGLAAFAFVSLVIGLRLLVQAWRTHEVAEITLGLSLFLAGGVGAGLSVAPSLVPKMDPQLAYLFLQTAELVTHIGLWMQLVFVWRIFRPTERWGAALFFTCTVCLIAGFLGIVGSRHVGVAPVQGWGWWTSILTRTVAYGWATVESFRYYGMLRRRQRLGLADPLVVNRFFLWGVGMGAVVLIWLNLIVTKVVTAGAPSAMEYTYLTSAILGFTCAGSLGLAFLAPQSYSAWIKRRADATNQVESATRA